MQRSTRPSTKLTEIEKLCIKLVLPCTHPPSDSVVSIKRRGVLPRKNAKNFTQNRAANSSI